MSLPATRFALPHVGAAGNQRPHPAACADPQVRGVFRRRQLGHGPVRAHDVPHLQRRHFPELPQKAAAPAESRKANDPRTGQCPISSCDTPGSFPTPTCPPTAAAVSAALQPAARSDRASLEADPAPGNSQSLLRNPSRSTECGQCLLQSLASTECSIA